MIVKAHNQRERERETEEEEEGKEGEKREGKGGDGEGKECIRKSKMHKPLEFRPVTQLGWEELWYSFLP